MSFWSGICDGWDDATAAVQQDFKNAYNGVVKANERTRAKNAAIDAKIARLEKAETKLNDIWADWDRIKVSKLDHGDPGKWSGDTYAKTYTKALADVKRKHKKVDDSLTEAYQDIETKISSLYSDKGIALPLPEWK